MRWCRTSATLGVSHLYLPPSFQARPGSTHGYDVVDPTPISQELGGRGVLRTGARARAAGLGVVLDIVPNHMATDDANQWWRIRSCARSSSTSIRRPAATGASSTSTISPACGRRTRRCSRRPTRSALRLVREGVVDGLRVDHPDGLADPAGYFERLRDGGVEHVWVEKILDPGEPLRDWPVDGTVGYEFLNDVHALFVDPAGEEPLTKFWESRSPATRGRSPSGPPRRSSSRRRDVRAEVQRLAREAGRPLEGLAEALSSLRDLPHLRPRGARSMRTIARYRGGGHRRRDPRSAVRGRRVHHPLPADDPGVMAKGVEDTAFYRYVRLLALNDVGGDPGRWNVSVEEFHAANAERAERFPRNLVTTMTHDTKRSHDVRARIAAISAGADEWVALVRGWFDVNAPLRDAETRARPGRGVLRLPDARGRLADRRDRLGPTSRRRCARPSATRAGSSPTGAGRTASSAFVARAFTTTSRSSTASSRSASGPRRAGLARAVAAASSRSSSPSPGVPDIYNGDELAHFALVDPDNRRPVDWERGAAARESGGGAEADADLRAAGDPRGRPAAFAGSYEPLDAGADTVAFVRGGEVLVAVTVRGEASVRRSGRRGAGAGRLARDHSAAAARPIGSRPRMRILLLSWEYPPVVEGGLARHVRKLSEQLVATASRCTC